MKFYWRILSILLLEWSLVFLYTQGRWTPILLGGKSFVSCFDADESLQGLTQT